MENNDHGQQQVTHRRVTMTPEWADHILKSNTRNRNFNHRSAAYIKIADALQSGQWEYNGEPIQVSYDGELLNGQHRLEACVRTGIPIDVLLIEGLPPKSQDTMDLGRPRTVADSLRIRGESAVNNLAGLITIDRVLERAGLETALNPGAVGRFPTTPAAALSHLDANPWLREATRETERMYRNGGRLLGLTPRYIYALKRTTDRLSEEDSADFWTKILGGENLDEHSPILLARRSLLSLAGSHSTRPTPRHVGALVIKAWNYYRNGQTLSFLRFRQGGANPERFPEAR